MPASKRDPIDVAFGERVLKLRKERNWTQVHLGSVADIGVVHISNIERGVSGVSLSVMTKLARAFGISVSRLVAEPTATENEIAALLDKAPASDKRRALSIIRALVEPATEH